MRPRARIAATVLAAAALSACSLSNLIFDVAGAGGAGPASSSSGAGGSGAGGGGSTSTGTGAGSPCGNGHLDPGEACDDGNQVAADGCSPTCQIDMPDTCPGAAVPLAPGVLHIQGDLTGAGDDLNPSCGPHGPDLVYAVTPSAAGTLVVKLDGNDKNTVSIRSSCNDSPTSELACQKDVLAGQSLWVFAGVTYDVVVDGNGSAFTLTLELHACGDGVKEGLEECDGEPGCQGCLLCNSQLDFRDPVGGHCYRTGGAATWSAARSACVAWGGDLAGFSRKAELDFVAGAAPWLTAGVWTSGNDLAQSCQFSWADGERWAPFWAAGEPNNQNNNERCVQLGSQSSAETMNDVACSTALAYLCERAPAGGCGDGILQPGEECDDGNSAGGDGCEACHVVCKAGEFEDPATQHCYALVAAPAPWAKAKSDCAAIGGYLASLTSPAEIAAVTPHLKSSTWIGGQSSGAFTQKFLWQNGEVFCFTSWALGSPMLGITSCIEQHPDGTWNNPACTAQRPYLCERDP